MGTARVFYYTYGQVRFDAETLDYYFQFIDPLLLEDDLLESVLHLHSQPPLFNLFLGVVLKVFGSHYALAFNVIYVGAGAILVLTLVHLQIRLGVSPRLALVVAGLFAVSPVTMLYENWLYPTYLIAAMLTLATMLLHRYLTYERLWDAVGFFVLLSIIVLTRGVYHPLWFLLPAVLLLVATPSVRRRTLLAMAVPLALVVGASTLNYAHFASPTTGTIYQDLNLAQMTTLRLPAETRERLIRQGKISAINRVSIYYARPAEFARYVPPPAPTGIALLDQDVKSTGAPNWHSAWFMRIADRYGKDARFVLREYPEVYISSIRQNIEGFFLPADQSDPFRIPESHGAQSSPLSDRMVPLIQMWDLIFAGQIRYEGIALFNVVSLVASVAFAFAFVRRWFSVRKQSPIGDDRTAKAGALTVLFMVYNLIYVAAVTVVLSSGDHSRYRFDVMPLVCVLLTMLVARAWVRHHQRSSKRHRRVGTRQVTESR